MPRFSRGYGVSRDRANKSQTLIRSCFNCDFYYKAHGDTTELCQNPGVLRYDMVQEGGRIYCLQWRLSETKDEKTLYKRPSLFKSRQ